MIVGYEVPYNVQCTVYIQRTMGCLMTSFVILSFCHCIVVVVIRHSEFWKWTVVE